ncbi:MAG: apolipoprotein N-acyltransferase, partial [Zetaproteobacteria bacterium]
GNLLLDTPGVGWLAVLGVYGASCLVCLPAIACLLPLWTWRWRSLLPLAGTVALYLWAPAPYPANGDAHHVALIQPNIPQSEKWRSDLVAQHMRKLAALTLAAQPAELVVWPEAAVPFFPSRAPQWTHWLRGQARHWQGDFLFGGLKLLGGRRVQNGLYLWTVQGGEKFSPKRHLVPFGEYVPAWLPWLHKLVPDIGDFQPGRSAGVLAGKHGRYGTLVCYESIFPEEARARVRNGANVLVVVTNDAWYGHSPAAWQHFQAARARAVETGRFVLRSGNTGITAIIGPDGRVQQGMRWWTAGSVRGTYRLSDVVTPYQRLGDSILACMLLIGGMIYWRTRA